MRILYICTELSSGMIPYASTIINAMAVSPSNDVYALTTCDGKRYYSLDFKVHRIEFELPKSKIPRILYKFYPLKLYLEINKICKEYDIKIVHSLTLDYVLAPFLKRIIHKQIWVYTVHDAIPHDAHKISSFNDLYNKYIIVPSAQKNIKKSPILVTNSKEQFKYLQNQYPEKKLFFHHFPSLITSSITMGKEKCPELEGWDNYILFFGHIAKYKGVEYLYNAYTQSDLYEKHNLVIAGMGTIYFERDIKKERKIRFINRFIKDEEIKSLYKNAICIVYPYISITQSGVLSLAYYCKSPVIATDLPYFKEVIQNKKTGIIVPIKDSKALASAIHELIENKEKRMQIQQEQERAYSLYYSNESIVKELNHIYLKIESKNSSHDDNQE